MQKLLKSMKLTLRVQQANKQKRELMLDAKDHLFMNDRLPEYDDQLIEELKEGIEVIENYINSKQHDKE